jgi:hypothetical protein
VDGTGLEYSYKSVTVELKRKQNLMGFNSIAVEDAWSFITTPFICPQLN